MKIKTHNNRGLRGLRGVSFALVVLSLTVANTLAATYPDLVVNGPSPSPTFPATFSAFSPPVSNILPNASAPKIAEWTRSNKPGDTMAMTGSRLTALSGAEAGNDTQFIVFGQLDSGKTEVAATIQKLDGRQVSITLPSTLPSNQLYLMWPGNSNGYGEPVAINQAEAWWVGPNNIAKGATFSVYGRNLELGGGTSHLYIAELGRWLDSVSANSYKADFILPSDIGNGSYTIWAHNGHGQEKGWGNALTITVGNGFSWNEDSSTWINVKSAPYNAKGDGSANDYAAIHAALRACPAGGTIYLPAGSYLLGETIWSISSNKRILGAGMGQTVIKRHPLFNSATSEFLIINVLNNVEIKDLTLDTGDMFSGKLSNNRGSKNVLFSNVEFSQRDWMGYVGEFVDIHSSENITYRNCRFITSGGIFLGDTKQLLFENCSFKGIRDCNGMVYEKGGREVSFINCTAQPLDESNPTSGYGWSKGRWIVGSGGWGAMRNFYFGGNTTTDMMPREPIGEYVDQNSGEQILFEGLKTTFRGQPSAIGLNTVRFLTTDSQNTGDIISIVGGEGIGQSREIIAFDAATGTITIDEPWRVMPDTGSTLVVGNFMSRMVVYGNYFDGMERATSPIPEDYTASCGVSAYGGCSDLVVDNNTFHQLRTGFGNWGNGEPTVPNNENIVMQPSYFNLYVDNQIKDCLNGILNQAYVDKPDMTVDQDIVVMCNVFRRNKIENIRTGINVSVTNDKLLMDLCVYDQNNIINAEQPIQMSALAENQVLVEGPPPPDGPPAPVLTGISLTGPADVTEGTTAQYTAMGNYSDGTTAVVAAVWSENSASATINSSGLLTTGDVSADQVVTVTASYGGYTKTYSVNIMYLAPVLSSITISGATQLNEETTVQYACTANYSDGTTASVTATWSENSSFASINASGLLSAGNVTSDQSITITAIFGGKSDTHAVSIKYVAPVLSNITIAGPSVMDELTTGQYICIASYSDGTSAVVASSWSENSAFASITTSGLLSAGNVASDQSVTVTASFGGKSDTHAVSIKYIVPVLSNITISGPSVVNELTTAQYTCTASYSDGTSAVVASSWSENSAFASITTSGLLSAGNVTSDQSATVTASYGGMTATKIVSIKYVAPVLSNIAITGSAIVNEESLAQYICTVSYSDGTSMVVVPSWSENSAFVTIDASGLLSAGNVTSDQSVTITAGFGGMTATKIVSIKYVVPTLAGLVIAGPAVVDEESSAQYTCTASYSDGTSAVIVPTWVQNSGYASINASGLLITGNVTVDQNFSITASYGGLVDTHAVTMLYVAPPVVLTGITVAGPSSVDENATAQFVCTATYSDGTSAVVTPTWSENSAFASIATSGLLTAGNIVVEQNLTVAASFGGKVATQSLTLLVVGTQISYRLSGYDGQLILAELWDDVTQSWRMLGQSVGPDELVIEDLNSGQWYWLRIKQYDEVSGLWVKVHSNWISM